MRHFCVGQLVGYRVGGAASGRGKCVADRGNEYVAGRGCTNLANVRHHHALRKQLQAVTGTSAAKLCWGPSHSPARSATLKPAPNQANRSGPNRYCPVQCSGGFDSTQHNSQPNHSQPCHAVALVQRIGGGAPSPYASQYQCTS